MILRGPGYRGSVTSVRRTTGIVACGAALAALLVACGATVRHDLYDSGGAALGAAATSAALATSPSPSPSTATPSPPASPTATATAPAVKPGTLLIGDSVMLGAKAQLVRRGLRVDAVESRQFHTGLGLVTLAVARGTLPRTLVVHLGTNGSLTTKDCRAVVDAAGPDRQVFLMTPHAPRSWIAADIMNLRRCVAGYPAGRAVLVDWNAQAARHRVWFYADGIHLNGRGRAAYASVIAVALATHRT